MAHFLVLKYPLRHARAQEYDQCFQVTRSCIQHADIPYAPQSMESIRTRDTHRSEMKPKICIHRTNDCILTPIAYDEAQTDSAG